MNILNAMYMYSSDLYIVKHNDKAYVMDRYREGNEDYDYGVWSSFDFNKLSTNEIGFEEGIPEIHLNGTMDFLLDEDLCLTYGVSKEVVSELRKMPFDKWAIHLKEKGYKDVSVILSSTYGCDVDYFEPLNDQELKKIKEADGDILDYIEAYENKLEMER